MDVTTFVRDTEREAALKPLEEASEIHGAYQRMVEAGGPNASAFLRFAEEIADCVTACANLADRFGIDLQQFVDIVERKNRARGYYRIDRR